MQITREETDARHGRYVARIEGTPGEAVLIYTRQGPDVVSADHTIVPESMGGKGVGKALLAALLADAERDGLMIVPVCSFVQAQYARHPEWARHFTSAPGETPAL
ncbi:GNAT family N-acetyltransferase [Paenirhodobacter enshiensis]|uniref:GNAT family N-acetyltransferase n=1 Tax=Paenirhodobacter enshiensis TaxID=1105367 RepID=UPI0035B19916